jgi:hypothetical protein
MPLYPFFVILVVESLSRVLVEAKRTGDIKGSVVIKDWEITHMLFVVDILLFSEGSKCSMAYINASLLLFQKVTEM